MRMGEHRGMKAGSIVLLAATAVILGLYAIVIPSLTGHESITADLGEFAVAVDSVIVRTVTESRNSVQSNTPQGGALQGNIPQGNTPQGGSSQGQAANAVSAVPTAAPKPTAVPNRRFTVSLAGSISMNQEALKAMTRSGTVNLQPLFEDLAGAMKADLSLATLENTVIADQKTTGENMPQELLTALAQTGINTLCVGYNGILNSGLSGAGATKQAVRQAGFMPFGVFDSPQDRLQQAFTRANGIQVALLHFQDTLDNTGRKKTTQEERETALIPIDIELMKSEIAAARKGGAQLVLVSLCWGKPGADAPTEAQRSMAQQLADAGADLIVGTHTQTVQQVEILKSKREDGSEREVLCAYSLGNLCSANREKRYALAGMILYATYEMNVENGHISLLSTSYLPTYSWRGKENGAMTYRTLRNDGATFHEYIDTKQKNVMTACYRMITEAMQDTAIPPIFQ